MAESAKKNPIEKCMVKILREIEVIGKNRVAGTGNYSYNYRGIDDFFNAIHPLLAKYGVFLLPNYDIIDKTERPKLDNQGRQNGMYSLVKVKGSFRFTAEDGSFVEASCIGEGIDPGDKASNKAMAAALKYVLMQTFCVACEGAIDSETDSPTPQYQQQQQQQQAPQQTQPQAPPPVSKEALEQAGNAMLQLIMNNTQSDRAEAAAIANEIAVRLRIKRGTIEGIKAISTEFKKGLPNG